MFTVLTKYRVSHIEYVTQASTVEYFPQLYPEPPLDPSVPHSVAATEEYARRCAGMEQYNRECAGLLLHKPDGSQLLCFTPQTQVPPDENLRDVFVMNEAGATVAKYTL